MDSSEKLYRISPGKLRLKSKRPCTNDEITGGDSVGGEAPPKLHPLVDLDDVLESVFLYVDKTCHLPIQLVCKSWLGSYRNLTKKQAIPTTFYFNQEMAIEFIQASFQEPSEVCLVNWMKEAPISLKIILLCLPHTACSHAEHNPKALARQTAYDLLAKLRQLNIVIESLDFQGCSQDLGEGLRLICSLKGQLLDLNYSVQCSCEMCSRCTERINEEWIFQNPPDPPPSPTRPSFPPDQDFPSLRRLKGSFRPNPDRYRRNNHIHDVFKHLVINSPGIEEISCLLPNRGAEIFELWREKEDVSLLSNLKTLTRVILNSDDLYILNLSKAQLIKLTVEIHCGFRVEELATFLSSSGGTLKRLKINFNNYSRAPEEFPAAQDLVRLKDLSIQKFYGSALFVAKMPALTKLYFKDVDLSVAFDRPAEPAFDEASNVQDLRIYECRGTNGRYLLPALYTNMISIFPGLRVLRMEYFTDSSLRIVIQGLIHLEELEIPRGIYSDDVLGREDESVGGTGVDEEEQQRPRCLTDLKKLRKVYLQSPRITDRGIQFGLMKCKELRSVQVDTPLITDASLSLLSQNDNLLYLEFNDCYQLTQTAMVKARKKFGPGRTLKILNT